MTRRVFGSALLAATLPVRAAETRATRGKRLLQDAIAALGGDAFLRMRDRKESGRAYTFYRDRLTGLSVARLYTRYTDHPEPGKLGLFERHTFGKKGESSVLFLDGQGFEVTFRGARPLPDETVERYFITTRHNFFYILRQRLQEPDLVFEHAGSLIVENQPVEVLDIFDSENENVKVYLNASTKLPVQQQFYRRDPIIHDRVQELTHYSKYKSLPGGVVWPLNLQRERDTEKITEIYDDSIEINAGLPDDLFRLPSGIEILRKEKS